MFLQIVSKKNTELYLLIMHCKVSYLSLVFRKLDHIYILNKIVF
jgi:hypothetical protein